MPQLDPEEKCIMKLVTQSVIQSSTHSLTHSLTNSSNHLIIQSELRLAQIVYFGVCIKYEPEVFHLKYH